MSAARWILVVVVLAALAYVVALGILTALEVIANLERLVHLAGGAP